jgi:hypothetical protein
MVERERREKDEFPLTMVSVCACVQPKFASAFLPGLSRPPRHERLYSPRFVLALADFEPGAAAAVVARLGAGVMSTVVRWCGNVMGATPETCEFLAARTTQVFVLLAVLPEWLMCEPGVDATDRKLNSVLDPWFSALRGPTPPLELRSDAHLGAVAAMRMMSAQMHLNTVRQKRCATTLCALVSESRRIKRWREIDDALRLAGFPALVPPLLRTAVLVCVRLGLGDIVPPWMMPPLEVTGAGPAVGAVDLLLLVDRLPPTRTPAIDAFEFAVFGGRGDDLGVTMRQALVFAAHPEWADEWKARGWPTSAVVQKGLAQLHAMGWGFRREDAEGLVMAAIIAF